MENESLRGLAQTIGLLNQADAADRAARQRDLEARVHSAEFGTKAAQRLRAGGHTTEADQVQADVDTLIDGTKRRYFPGR